MIQGTIAKGAVISYVSIAINIILTFFYTPWMIREIGMSDYGIYSLIYSFISYFLLDFGLSKSIQRFIVKYRAEGNEEKVSNMLGLTTKVYLLIDAGILLCLTVAYFFLTDIFTGLTPEELERLRGLYGIAGLFCVLNFMFKPMDGAMLAYEYFVEQKLLEMFQRVGTIVLIIGALLLGGDVYALVLVNGLMAFLVSLMKYFIFRRKSHVRINLAFSDRGEMKSLFTFSFWVFFYSLAQQMRMNLMPSVLGITANSTEISLFAVARSIEGLIFTISFALNGLFLPKVARIVQHENTEEIDRLMLRLGRIQLFIFFCILSGFVIFGEAFLDLWVGSDFLPVYYVLIFMIFTNLVSITQVIAADVIYVKNKVKYSASVALITAFVALVLAFFLSARYGALGCGMAIFIGTSIQVTVMNRFYSRKLGMSIGHFFRECHLKILPVLLALTAVSVFSTRYLFKLETWWELFAGILIYVAVYLSISYFFLFNQEEKKLVMNGLKLTRK